MPTQYVTSIQKKKLELIQDSLHSEPTKGHDVVGQYLKVKCALIEFQMFLANTLGQNWKAALKK